MTFIKCLIYKNIMSNMTLILILAHIKIKPILKNKMHLHNQVKYLIIIIINKNPIFNYNNMSLLINHKENLLK